MSSTTSSLTVIICTYSLKRWADLRAAVTSAMQQSLPVLEVIIVVDHNDALYDRVRRSMPAVRVLASTGPSGLSGARNTGIAAARGDIVAFLDDDAVADAHWAAQLLDCYQESHVIGVGGAVTPAWRVPRPVWLPDEFLWVVGCSYQGQPASRAPIRNAIGASMSFRRAVLERSGGFDPSVGRHGANAAGCEETELSIRVRRQSPGGTIMLEPLAKVRHTVTAERVSRGYFRNRCRAEGRSKAVVAALAGSAAALSSERTYVTRTLPLGVGRGLGQWLRGDSTGLARALAILEGLTLTTASYLAARARPLRPLGSGGGGMTELGGLTPP